MSDLDRLHEIADVVRPPAFEELLETRRRRTRRARLATASTLAVAGIAAVAALAVTGGNVRTDAPPVVPPPPRRLSSLRSPPVSRRSRPTSAPATSPGSTCSQR